MRSWGITRALLLACVLIVVGGSHASSSGSVLRLDAETWEATVRAHPFIAVEFYAPWCAHCKRLEPEWAKAAEILGDTPITLAKIDATRGKNAELAEAHDVKGFPTVKIFRDGDTTQGEDLATVPRTAESIVTTMERLSGPSTVALATSAEVRAFVARAPVVALGVFDDGERATATLAREYETAARRLAGDGRGGDIVVFGRVTNPGLLPDTVVQGERVSGAVYVLKGFDEGVVRFAGEPTAAALSRFIEGHSLPLVAELDRRPESRAILRRVFEHRAPKVIAFVDRDAEEGRQRENIVTALREVAASGETEFRFVVGEASENAAALQYFDVASDLLPAIVLHDTETDKKYLLHEAKPQDIAGWLAKYDRGFLNPSLKSEPEPPARANRGAVKIVVAKSFERLVTGPDATNAALIQFYAPWCGHCKRFAPTYEKVGQYFASDGRVTVAKMDAVANDVPDARFVVKGFPAVYLKVGDSVFAYNGDRSEEDLIKFVRGRVSRSDRGGHGEL
jgi:protein disulfide-isomerase A1